MRRILISEGVRGTEKAKERETFASGLRRVDIEVCVGVCKRVNILSPSLGDLSGPIQCWGGDVVLKTWGWLLLWPCPYCGIG